MTCGELLLGARELAPVDRGRPPLREREEGDERLLEPVGPVALVSLHGLRPAFPHIEMMSVTAIRPLGSVLMAAGAMFGVGVAVAMIGGIHVLPAMPWIASVGLAKLTLLGSGGLMAAGAVCNRLALRADQRKTLPVRRYSDDAVSPE